MDQDQELRKAVLEMLLQIAQEQRTTAALLETTMRFLTDLVTKPAMSETDREARFLKKCEEMQKRMEAFEKHCIASVEREANAISGKQRYWESAVGNLQAEVSALIRKTGENRDSNAIDGVFRG